MVKTPAKDITKHEKNSMFLRPSDESASVERTSPPTRQPMKKEEVGKPVMIDPAHSRFHSDMMDACMGQSHAHESFGRWQMLEIVTELHDSSPS